MTDKITGHKKKHSDEYATYWTDCFNELKIKEGTAIKINPLGGHVNKIDEVDYAELKVITEWALAYSFEEVCNKIRDGEIEIILNY